MAKESIFQTYVEIVADSSKLDKAWHETEKKSKRAAEKISREASSKFSRIKEKLTGDLPAAYKNIAKLSGLAFAGTELINYAKEAVNLASKLQGVKTAFDKINKENLLDKLKKATRGTVTELELMQTAVKAENFNIPLDVLAKGFKFATARAIETGQSVDYLVNSFVDGLGRKSTRVLDNLGFSLVEIQNEVKKTGDFNTAIGNIIDRSLSKTGEVVDTSLTKFQRLSAQWEDMKAKTGKDLVVILGSIASAAEAADKAINDSIPVVREFLGIHVSTPLTDIQTEMKKARSEIEGFISKSKNIDKPFILAGKSIGELMKRGQELLDEQLNLLPGSKELADNLKEIARIQKIVNEALDDGAQKIKDIGEAFEKLKFLSTRYYDLQVKQIEDEAKKLGQLTGDSIAAKQYEIEQKKKLDEEYFKFKLDKYKEDELARRASETPTDPRAGDIKPKLDETFKDPTPILSKEDHPGLLFVDESLKGIDKLHQKMLSNISDFGSALSSAFDRSGESFISKLGQALQIATSIASAIGAFNTSKKEGGGGIGDVLGLASSFIPGFSFLGGLFKEGGSRSNKSIMPYMRVPKFAGGVDFTVPQGYPNDNFFMGVQTGEDVKVTPSNRAGETDRLLGILIGKVDAVNNTLFNKDLSVSVQNNAPDVDTTVVRNKKVERKLNKTGKNLNER